MTTEMGKRGGWECVEETPKGQLSKPQDSERGGWECVEVGGEF